MSALSELTRCILPSAQTSREAELKKEIFERCSVVLLSLTNTEGCKPVFCAPQPRSLAAAPQIRRANICTSEPILCRTALTVAMAAGTPVDREAFPHYHELIREPMDFSTVGLRLERGHYRSAHAFAQDVRLTLLNCLAFETEGTPVVKLAQRCA